MPEKELRQTLDRLQEQLRSDDSLAAEDRARLEAVLDDIEQRLDPEREDPESEKSLAERLREAAESFEESHPQLTLAIGAVARMLANLGI